MGKMKSSKNTHNNFNSKHSKKIHHSNIHKGKKGKIDKKIFKTKPVLDQLTENVKSNKFNKKKFNNLHSVQKNEFNDKSESDRNTTTKQSPKEAKNVNGKTFNKFKVSKSNDNDKGTSFREKSLATLKKYENEIRNEHINGKGKKRKRKNMNILEETDEIEEMFDDSEIEDFSEAISSHQKSKTKNIENNLPDTKQAKQKHKDLDSNENPDDIAEMLNDSDNEDFDDAFLSHKKSLVKLRKTDPEFYNFLQENDKKLLDFNISDSEDEEGHIQKEVNKDDLDYDSTEEMYHKPTDKLEVASDESDFEPDDEMFQSKQKDTRKIRLKTLKQWQEDLQTDTSSQTIYKVVKAFHAALISVSGDTEEANVEYIVEGSAVFNGIIQLCVLELQPAIRRFLKIPVGSKQPPHKFKKFKKIKKAIEGYLKDLYKLLSGVTSANILTVLLKHLHHMSPIMISFPKITKPILKRLIKIWSTAEETVRVIAYLCILRITNNQRMSYLELVLKTMYVTYVKNSKFVSPTTLPQINFMRRSLVELYLLDLNCSYPLVFLYIRQLAIHMRNAITLKKVEHVKMVYNWQYVNSLHLWVDLLAATGDTTHLRSLISPLVVICLETIKLVPTTQYYPLRFHCIHILITLIKGTGVYIPVLPFLYEILDKYDFNKRHKKVSMKPMQFDCILRLSKSQLSENGFKDAVIDHVYNLILEFLSLFSHSLAFPDLVVPLNVDIKRFLKKCTVRNYCKKMQQLHQKIEENSKVIEKARDNITCKLSDSNIIAGYENQIKNKGTPLFKFYENWFRLHEMQKSKQATKNDEIADYALPTIKRIKKSNDNVKSNEPVELFPSEDEDEKLSIEAKPKRKKRGKKKLLKAKQSAEMNEIESDDGDEKDIVQDLKASDW